MNAIIRNTGPRGARFYEDGGKLIFVNVIDASTRDGPREATDEDMSAHPEAFSKMGREVGDTFPGAKPMITFTGEPPPELTNRAPLSVPPPPREEPEAVDDPDAPTKRAYNRRVPT